MDTRQVVDADSCQQPFVDLTSVKQPCAFGRKIGCGIREFGPGRHLQLLASPAANCPPTRCATGKSLSESEAASYPTSPVWQSRRVASSRVGGSPGRRGVGSAAGSEATSEEFVIPLGVHIAAAQDGHDTARGRKLVLVE